MGGIEKMRYEEYSFPYLSGEKVEILAKGESLFPQMGIKEGKIIVDFGCGPGAFTIPIARIVGKSGIVFAIDKNEKFLSDLKEMAEGEGLDNIKIIKVQDEGKLPLPTASVDVFLLFDVLHHLDWNKIFSEVKRITKPAGKICVYPHHHLDREKLVEEVETFGLRLEKILTFSIYVFVVDDGMERG
ncbi:class I SAM-dependent methyltransferase [bacterium]|nr:class I SAM-dependent methyltransferase [bacterium]